MKFSLSWYFYFSYLSRSDFITPRLTVPLRLLVSLVLSYLETFRNNQCLIYLVDLILFLKFIIKCFDLVSYVSLIQPPLIMISPSLPSACCYLFTYLIWYSIELFSKWCSSIELPSSRFTMVMLLYSYIFLVFLDYILPSTWSCLNFVMIKILVPFLSGGEVTVDSSRSCMVTRFWNIGMYEKSYVIGIFLIRGPL